MNELYESSKKDFGKEKTYAMFYKNGEAVGFLLRNGTLALLNGGVLTGDYLNHKSSNEALADWIKKMNPI